VVWQLSRYKPNGKLLADNQVSYETKENPRYGHPQKSVEESWVPGGALGLFQKFSVSMLKPLQMVIKSKGNMTKY